MATHMWLARIIFVGRYLCIQDPERCFTMSLFNLRVIMPATSFALVLLGGGLYEFSVVDPSGMAVERLTPRRVLRQSLH